MFLRPLILAALALPVVALWLGAAPGGEACRRAAEQQAAARHFDYDREIFFAVFEGLYVDGVSNAAVDAMLATDPESGRPANFVWSCPICMPARDALRVYRARPAFDGRKLATDTFGPGLDAATLSALESPDVSLRQMQIMKLVESWLARRVDALRLNEYERTEWQQTMTERRKKGMALLAQYRAGPNPGVYAQMKDCPFCDAANSACGNTR